MKTAVVWFRRDLRLADNPALLAACANAECVLPLYVLSEDDTPWAVGSASRWWLHHSLDALEQSLHARGSRLLLRRGQTVATVLAVARAVGADCVYANRVHEPREREHETALRAALNTEGIGFEVGESQLLHDPMTWRTSAGSAYRVFTPFYRRALKLWRPVPALPTPAALPPAPREPPSDTPGSLSLLPRIRWDKGLSAAWRPGECHARARLKAFAARSANYAAARDEPAADATSRLSPSLHFGEISPRQVIQAAENLHSVGAEKFRTEIWWREFAHHLLMNFPHTPDAPLDERYASFPWRDDAGLLRAWQRGETGFPIVDAGMRELWHTGFMHNRVRMITASLLVKHLRIDWCHGARWFWDTLVDADLAANTLNWQWVAGCGADAAPYFRIFNPVVQSERFDPRGEYLHRWLPVLARLPTKWIHAPWRAPSAVLAATGVRLDGNYPLPIVDLVGARNAALMAFDMHRDSIQQPIRGARRPVKD